MQACHSVLHTFIEILLPSSPRHQFIYDELFFLTSKFQFINYMDTRYPVLHADRVEAIYGQSIRLTVSGGNPFFLFPYKKGVIEMVRIRT
jgi:hypothetical protein